MRLLHKLCRSLFFYINFGRKYVDNLDSNKGNIKFVIKAMLKFLLLALGALAGTLLILGLAYIDINNAGVIKDASYTENLQETLLFISSMIFVYIARKKKADGLLLVAGFLLCMFIREWDAVFDAIFHGAWKYLAIPTAVIFTYLGIRNGLESAAEDLAGFIKSKSYDIIVWGLIIVLVVSRVFGSKSIWLLMSGPDFKYVFKTFIEEGLELLGYMVIFAGSVRYYLENRK